METAGYPETYILTLYQVPEGANTETLGSFNSMADSGIAWLLIDRGVQLET